MTDQPESIPPKPKTSGILRRIVALIYDGFLLLGICFGYGVLVLLLRKALGDDTLSAPGNIASVFILAGLWGCFSLFYIWCWRKSGQTLGMKSWRLKLTTSSNGAAPSLAQCWRRCLVAPPLVLLGGIGYWWCLFDREGDSLQDKLTGTRVLVLPKDKHRT